MTWPLVKFCPAASICSWMKPVCALGPSKIALILISWKDALADPAKQHAAIRAEAATALNVRVLLPMVPPWVEIRSMLLLLALFLLGRFGRAVLLLLALLARLRALRRRAGSRAERLACDQAVAARIWCRHQREVVDTAVRVVGGIKSRRAPQGNGPDERLVGSQTHTTEHRGQCR